MNQTDGQVRFGLIGTGGIARVHADNVVAHDECVLVGGVDVVAEAREEFTDEYDVPTFESYDDLAAHGVDAVVITTPNAFHADYAVDALEDGVHVLCEKPLADTLENAQRIVDAAAASDAQLMIGFNNRFSGPTEHVVEAISTGRLGEPLHVEARWIRRRGIPGRGGWFTSKAMSGGGALIDIGVHVLDLALYLLGHPRVEEVSAVSRADFGGREDYTYTEMWGDDRGPDGFDVDDSVTAFIRCEDGKTISLDAAWATNRRDESRVTLVGTEGGAEYDFTEQEISFFDVDRTPESEDPLPTVVDESTPLDGHEHELNYFVSVIRGETPHTRNTVDQAYTVQRVIDAIYASSEDGHAVSLTDPTPVEHSIAD